MGIKYPITVKAVKYDDRPHTAPYLDKLLYGRSKCGDFVAVRPCGSEFDGKTYLGVLLGSLALSQLVRFNEETGELTLQRAMHNPMIYIPELARVVFGCQSFWGRIRDETRLSEITGADIQNLWYVPALKALQAREQDPSSK